MAETSQAPNTIRTYLDPWTKQLASATAATGGTRTITSAVVTPSEGTIVQSTATSTGVLFRLNTAGITGWPKNITVTVVPTLDNGDTDSRQHLIQVTNT